MSSTFKMLKPAGALLVPQDVYQEALTRSLKATRNALASGDLAAMSAVPPPPAPGMPVFEDEAGQPYVLVEPQVDRQAILKTLKEQDEQLQELLASRGNDADDEYGEQYFDRIRKLTEERAATMAKLQPPPRPIAAAIAPPPPLGADPAQRAAGGMMKMQDIPPMPGAGGANFAADYLAAMPHGRQLNQQAQAFSEGSAALSQAAGAPRDPVGDEYGEAYFTAVRRAAADRNQATRAAGQTEDEAANAATMAAPASESQTRLWNESEYHEAFFADQSKQAAEAIEASKSVTQPLPQQLFGGDVNGSSQSTGALRAPAASDEFFALPSTMGDMRGAAFTSHQSQDSAEFQSLMQQMMQEKMDLLNRKEDVLAMLDRMLAERGETTS